MTRLILYNQSGNAIKTVMMISLPYLITIKRYRGGFMHKLG